jgi:NACHT domain
MAHFDFSNVIIHGGIFSAGDGGLNINNRDPEIGMHDFMSVSEEDPYRWSYEGLHTLRLGVSLGAIHDSSERYPPPNCHPDTRKAVRQIILDWIHDSESSGSSFFWLYGSAGAGKTAILQAIAEFLCSSSDSESGHNFAASFFFSRGKKGRGEGHFLFSTIAYQLALKVPGLRQHVNHITELNPTLHTKSMSVQLQSLIIDAFQHLSPLPQRPYLVIIDGLDECHDKATQQSILRLLCETITVHKLPLRFLIGSRPESHIRDSFDQESLYTITRRVILGEAFDPGKDIQVFLRDGFAKICATNPILSHVEHPWPEEGIIDLLVQRSSGQFIYAATVLKFVGADFCNPTKQLALVLKPDSTAFSDLDQLYTQILSVYPSEVNIVQVLGIISVSHGESAEVMEDIFGMDEGELKLVIRGLSSLMKHENDENEGGLNAGATSYVIPHFAHASFGDYLFNSSRSGAFLVNRQEYKNQYTIRSFALIIKSIR